MSSNKIADSSTLPLNISAYIALTFYARAPTSSHGRDDLKTDTSEINWTPKEKARRQNPLITNSMKALGSCLGLVTCQVRHLLSLPCPHLWCPGYSLRRDQWKRGIEDNTDVPTLSKPTSTLSPHRRGLMLDSDLACQALTQCVHRKRGL